MTTASTICNRAGSAIITRVMVTTVFCMLTMAAMAQQRYSITFLNLGNKEGVLMIGWYRNAADFRKPDKAVISREVPVEGRDDITVSFDNVEDGVYAVAVFLDSDGDRKINTNILGIPKERYGFSNNVYPAMRAASFKEASFEVRSGGSQVIRLR